MARDITKTAARHPWTLLVLLMLSSLSHGEAPPPQDDNDGDTLVLWARNYESPTIRALVQLALDKTPEYPARRLVASEPMPQGRALRELAANNDQAVAIANVASSPEREEFLLPIAIPFDRGLLGLRICLIRSGDQERFSGISGAVDFRQRGLLIGQGSHWPDRFILQANGFDVTNTPRFESLFPMLRRSRFDCFLRGAGEIASDLETYGDDGIEIEQELLFVYDMPSYLFVAPDNVALAQRIELGLRRAIEDSSFDAYYERYFQRAIDELDLDNRRMIVLLNPYLASDDRAMELPVMPLRPLSPETLKPFPADMR